jgi:hypothetical protein
LEGLGDFISAAGVKLQREPKIKKEIITRLLMRNHERKK